MPTKRRIDMNNGNLKINFNGKNQYIEMSCHEFLDCLSYYISQNKIKTKNFLNNL